MEGNNTVAVISRSNSKIALVLPHDHFSREWPRKGATIMIPKEILINNIYNPGVERLFTQGFLYIMDEKFRQELGLEQPPVVDEKGKVISEGIKLVSLDDDYLNRIIKLMPVYEAKSVVEKLSYNQKLEVAEYAVKHYADLNIDKANMLTECTGINILKAVEMQNDLNAEA